MHSPLVSSKTVIQVGLTSFAHVIDLLRSQNVNYFGSKPREIGTVSKFRLGGIDHVESEMINRSRLRKERDEESKVRQKDKK